jgi:hypothetical protein
MIDTMLIWKITHLPYKTPNLAIKFVGKTLDKQVTYTMKKRYNLMKGKRGYDVNSINDPNV